MSSVKVEIPDDGYWRRQINCQDACPVNTDARGYVRAIARGDFESAYLIARGPNPLASICGRVCGAPCEAACRRGAIDEAISIRALKRFVTEQFGPESFTKETLKPIDLLQRVLGDRGRRDCLGTQELAAYPGKLGASGNGSSKPSKQGKRVAIIGSGPAGLAAAHDLAILGHQPVVFEMEPVPAGMLAVGIPEYRLPRELIRAEVEVIRALGVVFRCNTQVGQDIQFKEIREEFDATIVAVGAKRSRIIPLPGGDGPGVLGGVEFLRDAALANRSQDSTLAALGRRIVVIGGGNVAYDVSRTVIRQIGYDVSRSALRQANVGEVHLCCLERVTEMPADDVEILEGNEEGVKLHPSLGPVEILRDADGRVKGAKFKRCTRVFDEQGRFSPAFDEQDTTTIEADTIVWAIGQQADLSFVDEDSGVPLNQRGLIDCDPTTLHTSAADVFLAGDIAYGPRLLIDAVASGKQCARSVHAFLTGEVLAAEQEIVHLTIEGYGREPDYEKLPRVGVPTLEAEQRTASQSAVVETGYDEAAAREEASRCLDCGVNTIFDSEKCILCGGCADVCPELCLQLVSCDRLIGEDDLSALLRERYSNAELCEMSAIVKDEEKCIRCALCAERCPVEAITMERFGFANTWQVARGS
ncbi:MAG: FAD-dependent oxidoreductase [Phycisphaerae bacterium]